MNSVLYNIEQRLARLEDRVVDRSSTGDRPVGSIADRVASLQQQLGQANGSIGHSLKEFNTKLEHIKCVAGALAPPNLNATPSAVKEFAILSCDLAAIAQCTSAIDRLRATAPSTLEALGLLNSNSTARVIESVEQAQQRHQRLAALLTSLTDLACAHAEFTRSLSTQLSVWDLALRNASQTLDLVERGIN